MNDPLQNPRPVWILASLWALFAFGLSACATPNAPHPGDCISRTGHCFDAVINGQPVIPLRSRDSIEPFVTISGYVRDVEWQLAQPISGPVSVQIKPNQAGQEWLGPRSRQQVQVVPLGDYDLASRPVQESRDDVRIGGQAVTTVSHVLESHTLPPGDYLLRITARGNNWDRKTVFVVVQ